MVVGCQLLVAVVVVSVAVAFVACAGDKTLVMVLVPAVVGLVVGVGCDSFVFPPAAGAALVQGSLVGLRICAVCAVIVLQKQSRLCSLRLTSSMICHWRL